jgi:maltokinase
MSFEQQLLEYVARQRWFTGDGEGSEITQVTDLGWLREPPKGLGVRVELITVTTGGVDQIYNVPLSYRAESDASLQHALIGTVSGPEGDYYVYDALHDQEAVHVLVEGFVPEETTIGNLHYVRVNEFEVEPDDLMVMFSAEQSNTSIIIDERYMLKFFRRIAPGRNPDVEVLGALSPEYGETVPALRGWMSSVPTDGLASCDLAILQNFLRTASEGWESARASVRDLLAEPDVTAEEAGGDFAGESERLGAVTAHVHEGMARLLPTASWQREDLVALQHRLLARFDAAAGQVPVLEEKRAAVTAIYDHVPNIVGPVKVQRIHGDLHLAQTLRTSVGWKLIDFEGEPSRPLVERTQLDSPLRDVAGMLRSFDYVAHSALVQVGTSPETERQAQEWVQRNQNAFLQGYGLAPEGDVAALLRAYVVDKAIYEVVYEAHHRPTWIDIPLRALP